MADRHAEAAREMLAEARRAVEAMLGSSRPASAYADAMRRLDATESRIAEALGRLEAHAGTATAGDKESRLDTRDAPGLAEAPKRPSELADHWWAAAAKLEAEVGADNDAVQMLRKCASELDALARSELEAKNAADHRSFPLLYESRLAAPLRCKLSSVPWAFLAPYEARAIRNHDQSLKTLAERGGLGPNEVLWILRGQRWGTSVDEPAAVEELLRLVEEWKTKETRNVD